MRMIAPIAIVLACLVTLACLATTVQAQLPATRLDSLFPAGARVGATVEVTVTGNDLDDVSELLFSDPGITAKRKMAEPTAFDETPQPVLNTFVVSISDKAQVGPVDARVRGKYGLSNLRVFELSRLDELLETEPNNDVEQAVEVTLPAVVNGQINGNTDVDLFRFQAEKGQRILLDCRALRIDSLLTPALRLYDAKGREIMNARSGQGREALIDFQVSVAGQYVVRVSDAYYRGNANFVYRLAIGQLPHIDFIFPPAGPPGSNQSYTVYGRNLPGGKPAEVYVDGRQLDALTTKIALPADPFGIPLSEGRVEPEQAFVDAVEYQIADAPLANPVYVGLATAPLVLETDDNDVADKAQLLSPPCEVAGKFFPSRDQDWYAFDAKQGDAYSIEVISHRLGLPTDTQLVIQQVTRNDQGEQQVRVLTTADDLGTRVRAQFDTRSNDAAHQFVAPVDATYRVTVRDGFSALRSDPRLIYRLAIRKHAPDFRLVAVSRDPWGALVLRRGDRTTVDVLAERRDGLVEPIMVSVTGLPAGVTSSAVTLGPSMTVATLVLTASETVSAAEANLTIVGKAKIDGKEVTRIARCGTTNVSTRMLQPNQQPPNSLPARVSRQLALSVAEELAPFSLEIKHDKVWETTRAGILKIPYTAKRNKDYKGQVQCVVENLPANINRTNFSVANGKPTGEFQLTLRNNTPAGTYTLHAGAFVAAYSYSRNPEAAEAAKQRKEKIDKIAADADKAAKEANTAKQLADKAATDTASAAKAAEQKRTQLKQAAAAAQVARRQAEEQVAKAKEAAKAKPDDAALKNAVAAAEKKMADAVAKATAAEQAAQDSAKATETAQAQAQAAAEARTAATEAAEKATAHAKAAADEKKVTDKRATDTANAAKAKNINYWTASTPFTVKIHEHPITLAKLPESTKIKQGENVELPLNVTRLVDYKDQISFSTVIRGVSGLSVRSVTIPKEKNEIKLPITASATATPGSHEITLRATMRVNNQTLTLEQPLRIEIEAVAPKK